MIEDDGSHARISVQMAGQLPGRMQPDEVEGVGVDLYRGRDDGKNDYQVFASGEETGWYGYLYTPNGFVHYQGTFQIIGNRIVFTVPWSALGGRRAGTFRCFVDWSGPGPLALNPTSADYAPNSGAARFG